MGEQHGCQQASGGQHSKLVKDLLHRQQIKSCAMRLRHQDKTWHDKDRQTQDADTNDTRISGGHLKALFQE